MVISTVRVNGLLTWKNTISLPYVFHLYEHLTSNWGQEIEAARSIRGCVWSVYSSVNLHDFKLIVLKVTSGHIIPGIKSPCLLRSCFMYTTKFRTLKKVEVN